VHWVTLPWQVAVKTQAGYNWRVRTEERRFYDARGPVAALELSKSFVDAGLNVTREELPRLGRISTASSLYATWYKRVNLTKGRAEPTFCCIPIVGVPFSSWGQISRDLSGFDGNTTQGFLSQGVDWALLPGGITFRTTAAYRWRFRTKNRPFYNSYGPSVGVEFAHKYLQLGLERFWRRYPERNRPVSKEFQVYLSWYYRWDLKTLLSAK